jgi:hypothetical protein
MKFLNTKFLTLLLFLCMSNGLFGYTWGFSNHTKKPLVIGLGLIGAGPWDFNIVMPGKRVMFAYLPGNWYAGYCMSEFGYVEYDPNIKIQGITQNGGLDMYEPNRRMLAGHFRDTVLPKLYSRFKHAPLIFLPDELYAATVKAAGNIGSGFDQFLCHAVILTKILNKGQCPSVLSDIINWFGGIIARSACRDREIMIYTDPKTGEPIFTTKLN